MRCLRKGRLCTYTLRKTSSNHRSPAVASKISTTTSTTNRKRNRIPKACLRCRQLKVKCDRKEPCGRCIRVDGGRDCHYPTAASPSVDGNSGQKDESVSVPLYKQTFHSGLHWSVLVENIESLLKHRRWPGNHRQHAEQEQLFTSVDNLFGNIGPLYNATRRTLLSYIPPRDIADSFLEHYLDIIEPSHQILHVPVFKAEVESFWDKPNTVDDGWLAQFFAILALGCQLHSTPIHATQQTDVGILPSRLFDAAQVFLQRTAFMIRPELTSIRTLCLFVIFKQTKGVVCIESAALWPATDLIVRLAVIMGLHLADPTQTTQPVRPVSIRNTLWAAVILLDLRQSLAAGMPVIPPSRDLIAEPLFSPEAKEPQEDFLFPLIIYDSLPQIFGILELATSPQITLAYSLVATYDRQIRGLLKYYHKSFLSVDHSIDPSSTKRFQWTMINVFFRRVLLALHSRLYQEPQASTRYPVSYWSSLECSLALLSEQRELWDASSESPRTTTSTAIFFARLFQQEFFLAAVTVCFHLVEAHSPLVSPHSHKFQGQARRTILDLLASCKDIWGREKEASVCHSRSFEMIDSLLQILEDGGRDDECLAMSPVGMDSCDCHSEEGSLFCLEPWERLHTSALG
ncbi:hypothetical protein BDW59DRAFT_135536 [Aspergillus cavernicola]|uniref:Zn(2)-C6 fungal-type domain-containing protein n=1 Tax=Aspergillus cavernicola TaxID=176166 RepID=A0ABR4HQ43_9EURO